MGIEVLVGKMLAGVEGLEKGSDRVVFRADSGEAWLMWHSQDCCENVSIEDVVGDVASLIGSPILQAEEVNNLPEPDPPEHADSFTWTFYRLATAKGSVVIRWLGESNGYYSESVEFEPYERS